MGDCGIFFSLVDVGEHFTSGGLCVTHFVNAMLRLTTFSFISDFNSVYYCDTILQIERRSFQSRCTTGATSGYRRIQYYCGCVGVRPTLNGFIHRFFSTCVINTNHFNVLFLLIFNGCRGFLKFAYAVKGGHYTTRLLIDVLQISIRVRHGFSDFIGFYDYHFFWRLGDFIGVVRLVAIGSNYNYFLFLYRFYRYFLLHNRQVGVLPLAIVDLLLQYP